MATPISWSAALDPHELKEFEHSFQPELTASADAMLTQQFALPSDAIAAGLEIMSQSATTYGGIVWLRVNPASQNSSMFDGEGTVFRVRHMITTAAGRTLERSVNLTVKQL